ncbi:hypothetical protein Gohar_010293, partial [Gossypium harknessii]|nr:hypothetical protein [Gossypium harknessii]
MLCLTTRSNLSNPNLTSKDW